MKKPLLKEKDVLNLKETMEYFGFSKRKFCRFLKEGKGGKFTVLYGNRKLILRKEFENYLEQYPEVKEGLSSGRKTKNEA